MSKNNQEKSELRKPSHYNYELHKHAKKFTSDERPNYLGMSKKDYVKYMESLAEVYNSNPKYTLEDIVAIEQNKGKYVTGNTLSYWFKKLGVAIRHGKAIAHADEEQIVMRTYITEEMNKYIEEFSNKSDIVRQCLSWAFGIPTESALIVLSDTLRLFCLYHLPTQKYRAYLTRDVSDFEQEILNNLIYQANLYGPKVFREFCYQNDLPILGGLDVFRK